MSAFSSSLYSTGGNHQKRYLLRMSSTLTPEFKVEKKRGKDIYLKHIYMTEDERDSFIISKIWSLSKSPSPMIFLTNILWGRSIPLYPCSPPVVTATTHCPHSWAMPPPCPSPEALWPAKHSPCPPHMHLHCLCPHLGDKGQALPSQPGSHPLSTCDCAGASPTAPTPTRHWIHRHHREPVCCSLSQALCFSLVLTLFNNSLCLPLSHPKVII